MEIFLAKVIGLYFLIMGALVIMRRSAIMPAINDLAKNRALVLALGAIELAAGLSLVVAYPVVSYSMTGLLSLIGYMLVVESIVYFAFPMNSIRSITAKFNRSEWYVGGGLASIAIGAYLLVSAFGLW
ncbi:MAG: hypothetical protein WDZ93_01835 [Candidatus Paceibacterota bacterium]